jgi:hypothetical protein
MPHRSITAGRRSSRFGLLVVSSTPMPFDVIHRNTVEGTITELSLELRKRRGAFS